MSDAAPAADVVDVPELSDEMVLRARDHDRRPFALASDALFRATLLRRPDAFSVLALDPPRHRRFRIRRILADELMTIYRAGGTEAAGLPDAGGFAAYATWLRSLPAAAFDSMVALPAVAAARQLRAAELPHRRNRPPIQVFAPAICPWHSTRAWWRR